MLFWLCCVLCDTPWTDEVGLRRNAQGLKATGTALPRIFRVPYFFFFTTVGLVWRAWGSFRSQWHQSPALLCKENRCMVSRTQYITHGTVALGAQVRDARLALRGIPARRPPARRVAYRIHVLAALVPCRDPRPIRRPAWPRGPVSTVGHMGYPPLALPVNPVGARTACPSTPRKGPQRIAYISLRLPA